MRLDFTNNHYRELLQQVAQKSQQHSTYQDLHTPAEAFLLIVKGLPKEDLDNLCNMLRQKNTMYGDVDWYQVIQGNDSLFQRTPKTISRLIYSTAKKCIQQGNTVGSHRTPDGRFNTSSWISHSLHEAILAGNLAELTGENRETAETLGILHDIGRKKSHDFKHVPLGFEILADEGWLNEAPITLTHSFINGGRCTCCDPAEPGFSIDENGNTRWESEACKDDLTHFLEAYNYSIYDDIINVADLMATGEGIVSPLDRVNDIATRKAPDKTNRSLFLSEYINILDELLVKMGHKTLSTPTTATQSIDDLQQKFEIVSNEFFGHYQNDLSTLHSKVL